MASLSNLSVWRPDLKVLLFANTDWYLFNFRRSLAEALRAEGHEVVLASPPGPYGSRLEALGFEWAIVPLTRRSLNPIRELHFIGWMARLLKSGGFDLIHGFTIKCAVYGALAARLAGVQARVGALAGMGHVFTSHDLASRALRPVVRSLVRLALGGRGGRLVVQNPDDFRLAIDARLLRPDFIHLIPGSGVDCVRFSPNDSPRAGSTDFRVLLPARLLWTKGIAEFVGAARQLHNVGSFRFLLAGQPDEGNPASVPEPSIQKWVSDGTLEWLGHVDDMATLFRSVDLVVLPSYREGLPKGLIEAAASGIPLITTDVPGCREVVQHGVNGLLVPPRDEERLVEAIVRLQSDPALRLRLGREARRKALQEYDDSIIVLRTMTMYRELFAAPSQGRDSA